MALSLTVLVSGRAATCERSRRAIERGTCAARGARRDLRSRERARRSSSPTSAASRRRWSVPRTTPSARAWDEALARAVASSRRDLVVLAGFMRIVGEPCSALSPGASSTCTLPSCRRSPASTRPPRRSPPRCALSGCTVHVVDGGVDTGPILAQAAVPRAAGRRRRALHARIQRAEHRLLPAVVHAHRERCASRSAPARCVDCRRRFAAELCWSPRPSCRTEA